MYLHKYKILKNNIFKLTVTIVNINITENKINMKIFIFILKKNN